MDIAIGKINFNYSKKEKKIHLSEIVDAIQQYFDNLAGKNVSSISRKLIIYDPLFSNARVALQVQLNKWNKEKIKHSNTQYRCETAAQIENFLEELFNKLKGIVENNILWSQTTNPCFSKMLKLRYNYKWPEGEIAFIFENREQILKELKAYQKKLENNSKIRLARADLKYIASGKEKQTQLEDLKSARSLVTNLVTSMKNLIKYINEKHGGNINPSDIVKDASYYTTKMKQTKEHYKAVLNLIEKPAVKLGKEIYKYHIDDKTPEYKEYIDALHLLNLKINN